MKPIKNVIDLNNETLGYMADNVLMEIEPEGKNTVMFRGIYNFDLLLYAFKEARKQYPKLRLETKNYKPDIRFIEIEIVKGNLGDNCPVLQFRVLSKHSRIMYPANNHRIALAPIVTDIVDKDSFHEYEKANMLKEV